MDNEKTSKTKIVIAFAAGVCVACGIFYAANRFGWFTPVFGRANGVRSDGKSISEVKQQLDGAKDNQRELQKTADAIEGTSDKKLAELEKKSDELNSLCLTLKIKVKEQESLLTSVNQSLAELEKEYKLKQRRIKKQRNIAYIIAGCALYAAMKN